MRDSRLWRFSGLRNQVSGGGANFRGHGLSWLGPINLDPLIACGRTIRQDPDSRGTLSLVFAFRFPPSFFSLWPLFELVPSEEVQNHGTLRLALSMQLVQLEAYQPTTCVGLSLWLASLGVGFGKELGPGERTQDAVADCGVSRKPRNRAPAAAAVARWHQPPLLRRGCILVTAAEISSSLTAWPSVAVSWEYAAKEAWYS